MIWGLQPGPLLFATSPKLVWGLIASLLIVLWTGLKANKRTWEMLQFYFQGWASLDELERHIQRQQERQAHAAAKKN